MKYLLVTHIPFRRGPDGSAIVDALWAEDLRGLAAVVGQVVVAAPELPMKQEGGSGWGAGQSALAEDKHIRFAGLPKFTNQRAADFSAWRLRRALAREVRAADLVHSSNFFAPYLGLVYAQRLAIELGKKTVFVVAEDFVDFLTWNLNHSSTHGLSRWRTKRLITYQDMLARECVRSASVAFLHTPAAIERYRLDAPQGMAIRQPVHEAADIIGELALTQRLERGAQQDGNLRLVAACRLEPLKGLDFLLRAIALRQQNGDGRNITLNIYGQGSEEPRLRSLIGQLQLQDRVTIRDPLPPGDIFRSALAEHDAAAMPHLTNDFGRAFWDAMAAGLPVIAFRSAAANDTVRHGEDGLLAPMADVQGFADALRTLADGYELRAAMSKAARARALRNTRAIWNQIRLRRILEEFGGDRVA